MLHIAPIGGAWGSGEFDMCSKAFFIADDRIISIANASGASTQYRAMPVVLQPGASVEPRRLASAETTIVVESGTLEVMVNGTVSFVADGGFARIPQGVWFAYANAGSGPAHLLVRTSPPPAHRQACRVRLHIAAA